MKKGILLYVLALFGVMTNAQEGYRPSQVNLEAREWFQDAKFGMFIHWGVYSVMGGGGEKGIAEWIMENKKIPITAYEKLPHLFNPVAFDAAQWVTMAKDAGIRYITITSKHHDGFAMYGSEVSDYNIVDKTPYGKDIIKALAEECQKQGIKLFFYYSQLDWHHPDYYPRGRHGRGYTGRPESGDWDAYLTYMNAQLKELLTQYGPIGGIWFDGMWDKKDADWKLADTYGMIHQLQPSALIGSNHHMAPFPGEDFQMFEQDLPGENTAGFNSGHISELPLEMCLTINGSWGFNLIDDQHKTPTELVHILVKAAGRNANLLLNVGPMPNGEIQPEHKNSLQELGNWLDRYGETVYGTRGGLVKPDYWGVSTQKGDTLYLHVLESKASSIVVAPLERRFKSIRFFKDGSDVEHRMDKFGLTLHIPKSKREPMDTVIEIILR